MQTGFYSSAAGMVTQFNRLDTISNNLANVNTAGFKQDNLVIGDVLSIEVPGVRIVDEEERSRMTLGQRIRTAFNKKQLQMPGKEIGTLLVYKTFEQLSYAVVISSTEPATLSSRIVSP